MSPNEAFKLGFLSRCVEEGLSSGETAALAKQASSAFDKQAAGPAAPVAAAASNLFSLKNLQDLAGTLTSPVTKSIDTASKVTGLAKDLAPLGLFAAAAPPALGGLAAVLKNTATDISEADVEEAKQQELADTYHRMAEQLKRQRTARDFRGQRKRSGRVFM
jgi:hypothetical protein